MGLFTLEHSKLAYRADFALHSAAIVALAIVLVRGTPAADGFEIAALIAAGLLAWSGLEYLLHRFVLHGLPPFRGWHAQHHRRPTALIYTPTVFTAALVAAGVFLPMWLAGGVWRACALTLGILLGYLSYSLTHHAVHHSRSTGAWLAQRRRWHARHHQATEGTGLLRRHHLAVGPPVQQHRRIALAARAARADRLRHGHPARRVQDLMPAPGRRVT